MKKLKTFFLLSTALTAIWLLLGNSLENDEIITGCITALGISAFFSGTSSVHEIRLSPRSVLYIPLYTIVFLIELVKSNLDVAFRIVDPRLPIHPGIVKVKTRLKSKIGRITLANSITLTPGTLTVEVIDNYFYIHWIDVRAENIEESTEKIVRKFEKYLEVIFG